MKFLLHHIVTLTISLHTALGCCFHHAHACEVTCCETPAIVAEACGCDTHEQDNKQHGESPRHQHGGKHQCQGDACVFANTGRTADELDVALYQVTGISAVVWQPPQEVTGRRPATESWLITTGPPVRAHLLFQVLLT